MPPDTSALRARAPATRLAVFDVDGVLTDGRLIPGSRGEGYQAFHVRDRPGLLELGCTGNAVAMVTVRRAEIVGRRVQELGIEHVCQGVGDLAPCQGEPLARLGVATVETDDTGGDLPGLGAPKMVGLAITVANATIEMRAAAHAITMIGGGRGAVRENCDVLVAARTERGYPAAPTS